MTARVYITAAWRWDPEESLPYDDIGRLLFTILENAKEIYLHDTDIDGLSMVVVTDNPERLINRLRIIRLEKVKFLVDTRGGGL